MDNSEILSDFDFNNSQTVYFSYYNSEINFDSELSDSEITQILSDYISESMNSDADS